MKSLLARVESLEAENANLKLAVNSLTKHNGDHRQENERLSRANVALEQRVERLEAVNSHQTTVLKPSPEPDTRSQFTAFACTFDNVTMVCPTGRTILTTSAVYGVYDTPDSACTGCCAPNPQFDCTELVEGARPSDWLAIQALCDGQEACQFQNFGTGLIGCESESSDYMQLFYDCLPDDETGPVAFAAYANTGYQTSYSQGDITVFNEVLTNAGGHYNADTSSFICPWHGVYLVSVNIQGHDSDYINIHLKRNAVDIGYLVIDNISGAVNRGSTTIVIECDRGDILWVMAGYTGGIYTISAPLTLFTAHMIHRY